MVTVLIGRLHDALLPGLLPVAKIFFVVGTLFFFAGNGTVALKAVLGTLPGRAFAALTLAVFASVPFSVLKSASFEVAISWLLSNVPIALIVSTSIRSVDDLERLFRALVLVILASGSIILAGLGMVEYGPEGARVSLAGSYDPNDLATVIAASSASCLWAIRGRSYAWKCLGALGLLAAGYVIAKTGSRGGAVALGALVVGTAFFVPRAMSTMGKAGLIFSMIAGIAFAPASFTERMATLTDVASDYNVTAESGRIAIWTRGLSFVARSPVFGVGAGAYPIADGRWAVEHGYFQAFKWSAAHNLMIETAAELGLPGLLAMLCCLLPVIISWRRTRSALAPNEETVRLQRTIETLALTTITFLLGTLFVNGLYNPLLTVLTAMSAAAHVLIRRSALNPSR